MAGSARGGASPQSEQGFPPPPDLAESASVVFLLCKLPFSGAYARITDPSTIPPTITGVWQQSDNVAFGQK
jgi:hypothetical protein